MADVRGVLRGLPQPDLSGMFSPNEMYQSRHVLQEVGAMSLRDMKR